MVTWLAGNLPGNLLLGSKLYQGTGTVKPNHDTRKQYDANAQIN